MDPNEGTEGEERGKSPIFSRGNGESWLGMAREGDGDRDSTKHNEFTESASV